MMVQTPQADPPDRPHMAASRDQHSPSHCRAYLLRCAKESSWGEDDSNKKPPEVSLRRLFGPLGDPLVCAPFLDDGMIRVQPGWASPRARQGPAAPPSSGATFAATSIRSAISRAIGHEGRSRRLPRPQTPSRRNARARVPALSFQPRDKPSPDDTDASSESRIFQPTSSREAALGRSTGGKPGHRGGWKKRRYREATKGRAEILPEIVHQINQTLLPSLIPH